MVRTMDIFTSETNDTSNVLMIGVGPGRETEEFEWIRDLLNAAKPGAAITQEELLEEGLERVISEALMEHGSIRYEGYIMHPALEDGDISEWRGA